MSELPWLKNRKKSGGGGPPIERKADSTHPDKLIEGVAQELMDSFEKKDHQNFMSALRAFVQMMKEDE